MRTTACGCGLVALLALAGCYDSSVAYGPPAPPVRESSRPVEAPAPPVKPAEPEESAAVAEKVETVEPKIAQVSVETAKPPAASEAAPLPPGVGPPMPTGEPLPGGVRILVPERTLATDPGTGALRASFDDLDLLKVLNMDPVTADAAEKMPQWLKDLNGKQVILRGYMKPDFIAEGLTRFIFVRDTGLCCFGPVPRIYDMVQVKLKEGTTTEYIELRPFDVVGTFRIEMMTLDEEIYGLYFFDDARIIRRR